MERKERLLKFLEQFKNANFDTQNEMLYFYEKSLDYECEKDLAYGLLAEIDEFGVKFEYANSTACRSFRKELKELREDFNVKQFITEKGITDNFDIAYDYITRKKKSILKELKSYYKMKKKLENYYQIEIPFDKELEKYLYDKRTDPRDSQIR